MKALRFEDDRLRLADVPAPSRAGEALVRVRVAGVCNTDLEIARGYAGFCGTLGHEFVGVAVSAPGAPELEGRRVVGEINAGCGVCALCRAGDSRHCAARTGRDIETVKAEDLPHSLERAFDVTVEASGSSSGFETALRLLRPRGTLVLKSTFHAMTELNAAPVVVDEISIVGSRCGRFAPALELLRRGAVDVESLVHEEFPLAEGVRALERAAEPGVLKVLLRP